MAHLAKVSLPGMNTRCVCYQPIRFFSLCTNCSVNSLKYPELRGNWMAYRALLWPYHYSDFKNKSQREEFALKVHYIPFSHQTKWRTPNLTMGQESRSNFQVKMILTIENCSTKMKDIVSISFHVASLSPSLSRSLCLTLMACYKMWPLDVHLGTKKNTFHMLPISFEWLYSLVKVLLSLSLHFFLTLLHFSVPSFHFYYKNSPYSRSPGRPQVQLCSKLS